jgi:hypothetical protein
MKRTPFKKKAIKPMKRTPLRARTTLKRTRIDQDGSKPKKRTKQHKIQNKGYKPPKWFSSIKPGGHGNTPAQKKLWKLTSIAVRVEDFEQYGQCVACGFKLERWQDGQAGHYRAWSTCHGFFKYERKNLALICGRCNKISDGPINESFKQELKRRHGDDIILWINLQNEEHRGEKMEVWEIVERAEPLYEKYKKYL